MFCHELFILFFLIFSLFFTQKSLENSLKFPFKIEKNPKICKAPTPKNIVSFLETSAVPVETNDEDIQCITLCFGSHRSCHKLAIHGQSFLIWVQEIRNHDSSVPLQNKFNPSLSNSIRLNRTVLKVLYDVGDTENHIVGYTAFDKIWLGEREVGRGFFMLALESDYYSGDEGMIGLGYRGSRFEERISFVNQLHFNGLINHKVFTQSFLSTDSGELSFGEIPKFILEDPNHYGRCHALDKEIDGEKFRNRKWECRVNGIYFGEERKVRNPTEIEKFENVRASFFSFRKRALVPMSYFNYLEKVYFKEMIEEGKCRRVKIKKYDIFGCKELITDAPALNIVFGDWVMRIPSNKLFAYRKKHEMYEFILYHKDRFETWTLGRPIVRLFHMVYDYQNQEIGFYSRENVVYTGVYEAKKPKVYEYIPDKDELIDKDEENDPNKIPLSDENKERRRKRREKMESEEVMQKIKDGIKTEETNVDALPTSYNLQIFFYVLLVILAVGLVAFAGFLYVRHKKKTEFLKEQLYKNAAQYLVTEKADKLDG